MIRTIAFLLVSLAAANVAAQCPPSAINVRIVNDDTPGCADIEADADEPKLNVTNNCGDDQINISAGVDCPNCGPPLTLRAGMFGSFLVETRGFEAFTPTTPPATHVLEWAVGNSSGQLTVEVISNIVPCPEPDLGMSADVGPPPEEPEEDIHGEGGCCSTTGTSDASWLLLVLLFGLAVQRRSR